MHLYIGGTINGPPEDPALPTRLVLPVVYSWLEEHRQFDTDRRKRSAMPGVWFLLIASLLSSRVAAQARPVGDSTSPRMAQGVPRPAASVGGIQDNSFLIEEAYNQEPGVVQHISTFVRDRGGSFAYQFTQEWPVGGLRHQLSYTIPLVRADASSGVGVGDVRLNYRYQLVGDGDAAFAAAPRLTMILPSGDYRRGRGAGGTGVEAWLPVSEVLSPEIVVHGNLGVTYTPSARDASAARAATHQWTLGGSIVWLAIPTLNVLVEALYQRGQEVAGPSETVWRSQATISPGIRWAYNFTSGLQIVPGMALPLGVGTSSGERGVFLYLSFEHPFTGTTTRMRQPALGNAPLRSSSKPLP